MILSLVCIFKAISVTFDNDISHVLAYKVLDASHELHVHALFGPPTAFMYFMLT